MRTWGSHVRSFLCFLFLVSVTFSSSTLLARPGVTILQPQFFYPSSGYKWLEDFLQVELSQQILASRRFASLPANSTSYWEQKLSLNSESSINLTHLQQLHVEILIQASVQKVLSSLAITWKFNTLKSEKFEHIKFRRVYSWDTPDALIAAILKDWAGFYPDFAGIPHQARGFSWKGVRSFYEWKNLLPPPIYNSEEGKLTLAWKDYKKELEDLIAAFPQIKALGHYEMAILLLAEIKSTETVDSALLQKPEIELHKAIAVRRKNPQYHALMSLIYHLQEKGLSAKKEAILATGANAMSPEASLMYGVTVGKTLQAGKSYLLKAFANNPGLKELSANSLSPYRFVISKVQIAINTPKTKTTKPVSASFQKKLDEGKVLFQAKKWKEAKAIFEDAANEDPRNIEAAIYLARVEMGLHKMKNAQALLALLRERYPKNTKVLLYLGFVHEKLKELDTAEGIYREILNLEPRNPKALLRLGTVLIKTKNYSEAQSFLESLTSKFPKYTIAWWNLGILYQHLKQGDKAVQAWETAVQLEPKSVTMRDSLERLKKQVP